ncbi:MAG: hypothetical protein IKV92_06190 [Akkermansia sp.]|nr:hypothetical protein [Akkermansia sp.]
MTNGVVYDFIYTARVTGRLNSAKNRRLLTARSDPAWAINATVLPHQSYNNKTPSEYYG